MLLYHQPTYQKRPCEALLDHRSVNRRTLRRVSFSLNPYALKAPVTPTVAQVDDFLS